MLAALVFWDYAIIVSYLLVALGIGVFFSKRASESTENYFLGGRSFPWWMIGFSMVATSFASDTPLVVAEITRTDGLQRIWWVFVAVIPLIVGIFLFSRLWRRANIVTDAEFYELRYEGKSAAFLRGFRAFMAGIVQNLVVIGWVTYAMTTIITTMTDINVWWAVGVCMSVALVYATFSGFYGVVVTDCIQFFIAMFSMLTLAFIAVDKIGGMEHVLTTISATEEAGKNTLSIFPDFGSFDEKLWKFIILILVFWWSDANGYNMQRMSACRNEKDSVKATIFYAIFQCCRPWLWVVVGLVSLVLFPELTKHDEAYPMVMNTYLGAGLRGLLITAFLAAFMSTIDTHLNWGASYMMTDVYQRFIKKDASQKHYMFVAKLVVAAMMLAGVGVSLYIYFVVGSVAKVWEYMAFLMVGSGIISVLRWFWWRINVYAEITALGLGLIIGIANPFIPDSFVLFGYSWAKTPEMVTMPFEFKIALFTAIVLPLSILASFVTPRVSRATLERFYQRVRPGGFWGGIDPEIRNLPGKAVSLGTILDVIGGLMLCYGLSVAIGYGILLDFAKMGVCLLLAAIGAVIVYRWYKREVRILETINSAHEGEMQGC